MSETQLIIGLHAVRTALKHGDAVTEILLESRRRDARIKEVLNLARQAGLKPRQVEGEELDRLAQGRQPPGWWRPTLAPRAVMDRGFSQASYWPGSDLPPFLLVSRRGAGSAQPRGLPAYR